MVQDARIRWSADDDVFVATSDDLPMRSAAAATPVDALSALLGSEPALPITSLGPAHSTVVRLRIPRSLARVVRRASEHEGVSLETFILAAVTRAVRDQG